MRKKIVAGNWKMNNDWQEANTLTTQVLDLLKDRGIAAEVVIAPPYVHLEKVVSMVSGTNGVSVAAQNCHQESSGAYTGEVSAAMLDSIGVQFVILGHSERREYFKESNELLAQKVNAVFDHGLTPIFCCGEPLSIRESNQQMEYVTHQLTASLFHLEPAQIRQSVIAYEPIWAIGTGKTASAEQAQEMHAGLRQHFEQKFGQEIANNIPILYGGSCKPSNAHELFAGPDVDGGLIGGASLNAEDFVAIVDSL
ncbi:MAG: triose-phosphate isomerase [Cyclobacteriaceae bacterium]|nr:triose-phosphate isomerase [Cyclobacteriaceae bacterium]